MEEVAFRLLALGDILANMPTAPAARKHRREA